jgi:predicted DNA-binding transcriptional regulator YafY
LRNCELRAARLLQMLLLLQNRGRMTSAQLAIELEVTARTILRDVDAMTEAGLPIIAHQGNSGGIELGFNYRTRLTGLAADEAEAMAVILSRPIPELDQLGMRAAAERARSKLLESFPDGVREKISRAISQFRFGAPRDAPLDERLPALAKAVREGLIVRVQARSRNPGTVHPAALVLDAQDWTILDARAGKAPVRLVDCGDINISAKRFARDTNGV